MSIMQERVLSLIPHKPDGKFVHGAKADFARMLGFKSGAIVSDWESGKSDSYKNYLFQISALKGVSVEWLKGETDDPGIKKAPTDKIDERILDAGLIKRLVLLTPDELRRVDDFVQGILASRKA